MKPQNTQWFGLFLVIVSAIIGIVLLILSAGVPHSILPSWIPALVLWVGLGLPETGLGIWLIRKGTWATPLGDTVKSLITLVEDRGEISMEDAATELDVPALDIAEATDRLSFRNPPPVLFDASASTIVSPRKISSDRALLLILKIRDLASLEMLSEATGLERERVLAFLEGLTVSGEFKGQIDLAAAVVYAKRKPDYGRAISTCPNCKGRLPWPLKPGMQKACPNCGVVIFGDSKKATGPDLQ